MKRLLFALLLVVALPAAAAEPYAPVYRAPNEFPVLDAIEARRDALAAAVDSLQALTDARHAEAAEAADAAALDLRPDWSRVPRPKSPDDFKVRLDHLPPVPQYYTGTCWAYSSTSLMESEVMRLSGRRIKLSEMWTAYWEYVEKVRRWVREYGHSVVDEGSQSEGLIEVYRLYGAVPAEAYSGVLFADGRHDHDAMLAEILAYLDYVKSRDLWDEESVVRAVREILDRHMGRPPETFVFDGREYAPRSFLSDILRLDMDDYVSCVSRLDTPFGTWVLNDVVDNWRRSDRYLNIPLDDFYRVIREAVKDGYTVDLGGDNSEPYVDGKYDVADVPPWDIPHDAIDQGSREFRIVEGTTTDDHGIHAVGYTKVKGRDWFLIKDSNRSSRLGQFEGYYFFSGDFIKLKMLAIMVHKDRLEGLLPEG